MKAATAAVALAFSLLLVSGEALGQRQRHDPALQQLMTQIRTRAYDRIPAIDEPEFVSAEEASIYLRHGDRVIGVELNGEARAYPEEFLNGREVVNDSLGSGPITVTW